MVKSAIKVYARLKSEKIQKGLMNYQVLHRPKENVEKDIFLLVAPDSKSKEYPDNRPESWSFSFFRILEESVTQEGVFENVAQPVVESALDGYNGTIIAYGQTASGKTYTLTGRREVEFRGVIPRSLQYLFDAIRKRPENVYSIEVAYLEIYNETGYDLLDRGQQRDFVLTRLEDLPRIILMEDETGKLHTKNLSFHSVKNVEEAFQLLVLGDKNRVVVDTPMNPQSSRSHCIFTIVVSTKEFGANQYKQAKVHLVDLAGSERIYKCSLTGTILTEAKHINLSLHYLEQVIVCLGQESTTHIPYRNSLLTSILRDSLGGNCLTTMLATISLASVNMEETLATCRFAQRVALIKNEAKLNLETDIQSENALLRAENQRLRQQLGAASNPTTPADLTAKDKLHLDSQVRIFLETREEILWDYNPKKVLYCFESFKTAFELIKDPDYSLKRLEYYKDIIIQRDKEISLLIDMMKKGKHTQSTASNDKVLNSSDIQECKQEQMEDRNFLRKQKRRLKISNSVGKNQGEERDRTTTNSDKPSCDNVAEIKLNTVTKHANRESLLDDRVTRGPASTDSPKSNLLHCNTVNVTLSHSINNELNEVNQHPPRTHKRKEKIVENDTVQSVSKVETQDRTKVIAQVPTTSLTDANCSIPVYQKFLNFNAQSSNKCFPVEEEIKTEKRDFVGKLNSDESYRHMNNLPLTGDPDIDEEIIAFYKSKRSGGVY